MEILAIIPARGGSKGIPKKNLAILNKKSIIQYTIEAAKKSKLINRVILSSDDDEIISFCKNLKIEAPFKRPKEFSDDDSPMIDVLLHAINFLKDKENYQPNYIILLQPTSPLRTERHIDESLNALVNSDADSIVSVIKVPHNFSPASVMELKNGYLKQFMEYDERNNLRQKKPIFYARNGAAIYAFTYNCLINKKSIFGDKILPYFMEEKESIDIDNDYDIFIAEALLKNNKLF